MVDRQMDEPAAAMLTRSTTALSTRVGSPEHRLALSETLSEILESFRQHRLDYVSLARQAAVSRLGEIVEIREASVGRGVFARQVFSSGNMIATITGKLITEAAHASEYCMDFNETESLEPDAPFRFLNHSCEPNCELVVLEADETHDAEMALFTCRAVDSGDELTIDYGWPAEYAIPCLCGELSCRGWIVCPEELVDCPP